jgi:predicted DsbA family dithiol-disulfide isomerase
VRLAHHLAVASDWVRGDCIEATEFPDLAQRYLVMAVPKIVINERVSFEGALPEPQFVDALFRAVDGHAAGGTGAGEPA